PAAPELITNPLNAQHHSRLIVQVLPDGLKPEHRPDPTLLNDEINIRLTADKDAGHLKVVSHKWTPNGHCIIFTRMDQTAAELIKYQHLFTDAIAPGRQVKVSVDSKWVKIRVDVVRMGAFDRSPTIYSEDTLCKELAKMNPIFNKLTITMGPQWVQAQEEIAKQMYSSIVFAAEESEQVNHLLQKVKVMTYVRKRADFSVTLRSDIAKDLDLQVIKVSQKGAPTTMFVNVYNDTKQRRPATDRICDLDLPKDTPLIILGDTNLHHELWSCTDKFSNTKSKSFLEWIAEDAEGPQATLLNSKGEVTYVPHGSVGSSSVIDLTFVNGAAINNDSVQEWTIDSSMSYGSDHYGIRWVMDYGRTEVDNISGTQFGLKDVDPEDWGKAFRTALSIERDALDPILDMNTSTTNEQLEEAATALTRAMQAATAKVGK
ncbi:Endonuclease/exonuclease/phosphatase, partial [Mycena galopus ATCC 62051]